jgi:hypothetical protein
MEGNLVVQGEKYPGDNTCGAYHPEPYARAHFSKWFEVVEYVRGGATDVDQDVYLLRNRD